MTESKVCVFVPPERWERIETTPATERVWAERLGGPPAGVLAVAGAVGRGELEKREDGLLHMTSEGFFALDPRPVAQPMAQAGNR